MRGASSPPFRIAAGVALAALCGCNGGAKPGPAPTGPGTPSSSATPVRFTEIAEQAGIRFRHNNGATGLKFMPETVGSGLAFFDYDNDGFQDLFVVNSRDWTPEEVAEFRNGPTGRQHPEVKETGRRRGRSACALYRNNGDGTFADVTKQAGLDFEEYGMGAAVGDFDNDGFADLYVTAIGPNRLFRNTSGEGPAGARPIFEEVTAAAGLAGYPVPEPGMGLKWKWSASSAWLDYDKDGRLDLFVCNYVKWSPRSEVFCGELGKKSYCAPGSYEGFTSVLYHNEGSGKFKDVSADTGIRGPRTVGKSFGVAVADYNGDGWLDIAVANDTWPNFLFLSEGGRRFTERGVESGIALGETAKPKAGMGIDAADYANNGKFGLLIGNFSGESLSLWENDGQAQFVDRAHPSGMGDKSLLFLTFGLFFFDYDLDGWQDAATANGHIDDFIHSKDIMLSYKERPLLFHNKGDGTFDEVGSGAGEGLQHQIVGRGAAYADIDNDGDLDFAMVSNGDRLYLYRNDGGNANRWIRFRTVGARSNRDGIGAVIRVKANGVTQSQYVKSGGSFLSESQREPTFGLGRAEAVESVEVVWPGGTVDKSAGPLKAGVQYVVTEGQGFAEDPRSRKAR